MVHWHFDERMAVERMRETERQANRAQALGLFRGEAPTANGRGPLDGEAAMKVLLIGKNRETLEKILTGLRATGITAQGTTEIEKASVDFDAKDFGLVAFGGGVDAPIREQLKSEFKTQNPDVVLLDTFAPIAVQHIAAAVRGDLDKREFASRFEVTEHERDYRVRLDVRKACDVRIEVYHLGETLQAETLVERHVAAGPFEASIDENKIRKGLNMILVTLGGREFYFERIVRR